MTNCVAIGNRALAGPEHELKLMNSRELYIVQQKQLEEERMARRVELFNELNVLLVHWSPHEAEIVVNSKFTELDAELNQAGYFVVPRAGNWVQLCFKCKYRCPVNCQCNVSSHHMCGCGMGCGPTKK